MLEITEVSARRSFGTGWQTAIGAQSSYLRIRPLAQVSLADLHIPILGQLAPVQLPLGDALEPGAWR